MTLKSDAEPWRTAPPGGLTWRHDWLALQIWVPEGWKQDHEPARDPENPMGWIPICYREKDSIGTVRATAIRISSTKEREYHHVEHANAIFEKRKSQLAKEIPEIILKPQRSIVSYSQSVVENGTPIRTHFWEIFDERGMTLLTFTPNSITVDNEKLMQELSQVEEIVTRVVHLKPEN